MSDELAAHYATYLLEGNTIKKINIRVSTIKGYLTAINDMFTDKKLPPPIDLRANTHTARIIKDAQKYEALPNRRTPLSKHMVHVMVTRAHRSGRFSFVRVMGLWVRVGMKAGFRLGEYAQDTQKVAYYTLPDGSRVVKALTSNDVDFHDKQGKQITKKQDKHRITNMKLRFDIQKNRQNKQKLNFYKNDTYPQYCSILAMEEIVEIARLLGQPLDLPLGIFQTSGGVKQYLTGRAIADYFREVALELNPNMTEEELQKFSAHSIRVLACILLHEAGKDGSYIKVRLRWLSDAFLVYLRNTETIAKQHANIMTNVSQQLEALALSSDDTPFMNETDFTRNVSLEFTEEEF